MSLIAPGETADLSYQAYTYAEDLYPQIKLYKPGSNTAVATVNLSHSENGFYKGSYTGGSFEYLTGNIIIYVDNTYTEKYEGYDPLPYEITVKRFAQGMSGGGKTVLAGAMPEDLDKLKKKLLEELKEIKTELGKKVNKGEIELPKPIEQKRQSFQLDREAIIKEIKKIDIPELPKQDTKTLKEISEKIDKLPQDIPPTDFSGIEDKIESIEMPKDRTDEVIEKFDDIPPPLPAADLNPILSEIENLPIEEQTIALKEVIEEIPNKQQLINMLLVLDNKDAERITLVVKILNNLIPNLKAEYYRQSREMDNKQMLTKTLNEAFV